MEIIRVIDSHTEGEPTRTVIEGFPPLGQGSLAERREQMRNDFDAYRRALVCEPRGYDVMVGALLCEPVYPGHAAGVIFFNNVGYLGMCGHGTIGEAGTLAHLGRIGPGTHTLETPVGNVTFQLLDKNKVSFENIPAYRHAANVEIDVPGVGRVTGDIAWGGNWFFLAHGTPCPLLPANLPELTASARKVRDALVERGLTGPEGEEIDHIKFFGPPEGSDAHGRNFVLCPGGVVDRSPCGTGTSAMLACLAEDGKLEPETPFVLESVIGGRFEGSYRLDDDGRCIARITGRAFAISEAELRLDPEDPFRMGIGS
jgi:proline racemase